MLRADWQGARGIISYDQASKLLQQAHDYPLHRSQLTRQRWVAKKLRLVSQMPNVTRMPRYLMFESLLEDHGGDDAIDAHHTETDKRTRRSKAKWQQTERQKWSQMPPEDDDMCISQPVDPIVEFKRYAPCTPKSSGLYKTFTPPRTATPSTVRPPKHRRSSIVATRPMPSASAKQGHIPGFGPPPQIPSCQGQPMADPVSFRSRSDNADGKMSDVLRMPTWLEGYRPPRHPPKGNFDPRTNPAARRLPTDGTLSVAHVLWVSRQDKRLKGLSYSAMQDVGATDELLFAALHFWQIKKTPMTHPKGYLKWLVKELRRGAYRYAG